MAALSREAIAPSANRYYCELLMSSTFAAKASAAIVRAGIAAVGYLPLGLVRAFGSGMGSLARIANTRMAVATRQNIAYCLPELSPSEQQLLVANSLKDASRGRSAGRGSQPALFLPCGLCP